MLLMLLRWAARDCCLSTAMASTAAAAAAGVKMPPVKRQWQQRWRRRCCQRPPQRLQHRLACPAGQQPTIDMQVLQPSPQAGCGVFESAKRVHGTPAPCGRQVSQRVICFKCRDNRRIRFQLFAWEPPAAALLASISGTAAQLNRDCKAPAAPSPILRSSVRHIAKMQTTTAARCLPPAAFAKCSVPLFRARRPVLVRSYAPEPEEMAMDGPGVASLLERDRRCASSAKGCILCLLRCLDRAVRHN